MDTSTINYINLAFTWLLVLLSIWGYATVFRKSSQRMFFWLFFGLGWMLIGFSHIFTLGGISSSAWYMIALQVAGYISIVISIFSLLLFVLKND